MKSKPSDLTRTTPDLVLVADDEAPARRRLRRLLADGWPEAQILEAADGAEALAQCTTHPLALALLDIQMPGLNGLEVVEAVGIEAMPPFIFTTAYDAYAVRAFELHAVDYLLKPFDLERLCLALRRVRSGPRAPSALPPEVLEELLQRLPARPPLERLVIRENGRLYPVEAVDILWLEADDKYVRLHTAERTFEVRQPLNQLERRLDPARFVRVHRSALVNLSAVRTMESASHGDYTIVLRSGDRLTLSRRYADRLGDFLLT